MRLCTSTMGLFQKLNDIVKKGNKAIAADDRQGKWRILSVFFICPHSTIFQYIFLYVYFYTLSVATVFRLQFLYLQNKDMIIV